MDSSWKRGELLCLLSYALVFYIVIIRRSLQLSSDHYNKLYGLRHGWIANRLNDVSDAQWRNFRGNIPILAAVFGIFTLVANLLRASYHLTSRGMSTVWLLLSVIFAQKKYFFLALWGFNISVLLCNRLYEGYSFSTFGQHWAYLDKYRGTFRWHICFNFVILRMISFGCDYHWANRGSHFDKKERSLHKDKFSFVTYLCYLLYAPLYIAGPIISFNAFASQLDVPQSNYSVKQVALYGIRWLFCLFLMELMTHLFYYNAFAISGLWKQLSPMDIFIVGYGVLNFMWLKFLLIWRYFRFWSLLSGIEVPENMPKCINNCYNLESFWKNWHASYNKWLVRYMYIPLGGSKRKLINVWVLVAFGLRKLLSWAWLTCLFFIPELIMKSAANSFQVESMFGKFMFREFSAVAGAITITCLMVANLVGYVIGPSGINWLSSRFLKKEGLPTLAGMFVTFYVGTKG
ncbi:Membrane bound O-acyl transferase, MBOAT [Dillenia turbinata]|uniref:Membrane bound O-acyl transferase, MBOAT n=1 Tax=Dillenia turbinata TaxID=194707 RepID=A0AAN8UK05_9MAGN